MNTLYLFLIGLCALFGGLIGFSDDLVNQKWLKSKFRKGELKWLKSKSRFLFKVLSFSFLALLGAILTILKENNNDSISKYELKKQDSIAEKRRLKSNNQIIQNFSDGLAKYYLKYDSVNQNVQKIVRDSAKNVINIDALKPEFNISNIELQLSHDTIKYDLSFSTTQQAIYNLNAKIFVVERKMDNNLIYHGYVPFNFKRLTINGDFMKTIRFTNKENLSYKMYFYIVYNYEDYFKNKYNSSLIMSFGDGGKFAYLTEKEEKWILNFAKININN